MKFCVALALVFAISTTGFSQNKSMLTISAGGSFPIGDFADESATSQSAGLANFGQVINLNWAKMLNKDVGITFGVYWQRNPLDIKYFDEILSETPVQAPSGNVYLFNEWEFEKSSWTLASILGGIYTEVPFNNKKNNLFFVPRVMVGVGFAKSPEVDGRGSNTNSSSRVTQTSETGTGFSFLFSGGFLYTIGKSTFLSLNLDYHGTNRIKFKGMQTQFNASVGEPGDPGFEAWGNSLTATGTQSYKTINLHVGIAFRL